jgi:hypothetical protein
MENVCPGRKQAEGSINPYNHKGMLIKRRWLFIKTGLKEKAGGSINPYNHKGMLIKRRWLFIKTGISQD